MAKKKKNPIQEALDYHEQFGSIPKDYMERLSMVYNEVGFTQKHLSELIGRINRLAKVEWEEVTYIFYMVPKPTPRPRCAPNTFHFYVGGAKTNKDIMEEFMELHSNMDCVISTPCSLQTKAYIKTPNGMNAVEKMAAELELIHNVNAPDWDNIGKTYCDMVQDLLISNDSIVYRGCVEKFYSVLPRVEVTIRYMKSYDCKYNKRSIENRKSFKENDKTIKDIEYII